MWINLVLGVLLVLALSYSVIPTYYYKFRNFFRKRASTAERENSLYLTFDDGPDPRYTGALLDLLKRYNVKASFFVVAKFAEEQQSLIERMKYEGHCIGLHSLEHKNPLWQSVEDTQADFEDSLEIMKRLHVNVEFYRPPWGHFNWYMPHLIRKAGMRKILWDVMAQDWKGDISEDEIIKRLYVRADAGDIICLHDGRGKNQAPQRMLAALEQMLPIWIDEGYQFGTVDEIMEEGVLVQAL